MLQNLLYWLSRPVILLYARLVLNMDIFWQAPLPKGPSLIVANHPSYTDPFFVLLVAPQPVRILITVTAFLVPLFGRYLRWSGHVPVDPGKGREAFEKAKHLLEKGRSVVIFPEGNASPRQGGFRKPHTGVARLALLTGAPVIPVGIHLPREKLRTITSTIAGKRKVGYWYLRGPYNMTVGQALRFEGDAQDRAYVASVSEKIMRRIISLAGESEQRMKGHGSSSGKTKSCL